MFHALGVVVIGMAAGFQNAVKADQVGFYVCVRVGDGVANAGLGGEVNNNIGLELPKKLVNQGLVRQISLDKCPLTIHLRLCQLFDFRKAILLD